MYTENVSYQATATGFQFSVLQNMSIDHDHTNLHHGAGSPMGYASLNGWYRLAGVLLADEFEDGTANVYAWVDGASSCSRRHFCACCDCAVSAACVGVVVFSEEQNADVIFTFSFLFVLKTMGRL